MIQNNNNTNLSSNSAGWAGLNRFSKTLSIFLIILILALIGAIVYMATSVEGGESFTEFYILGEEGKADIYPTEIALGDKVAIMLGIINREQEQISYMVEIRIDGITNSEMGPLSLEDGEKWEKKLSFTPVHSGEAQKVEFILYKQGQDDPYLILHLWMNVKDQ